MRFSRHGVSVVNDGDSRLMRFRRASWSSRCRSCRTLSFTSVTSVHNQKTSTYLPRYVRCEAVAQSSGSVYQKTLKFEIAMNGGLFEPSPQCSHLRSATAQLSLLTGRKLGQGRTELDRAQHRLPLNASKLVIVTIRMPGLECASAYFR